MKQVRWGILSTAKIARQKVIPAMQAARYATVTAIASRRPDQARTVADRLGIPKAYGSYDALLDDPDVDAVYIPLPNHLHVPWSLEALNAGKHVLCEKPIACSTVEAEKLLEAARRHPELKVMEAFMYRFHPQWQQTHRLVTDGQIGDLRTIQTFFSYYNEDPGNVRNRPELGGGGLMDIGCYAISLSRFLFGSEPQHVLGMLEYDPRFNVDRLTSGLLEFSGGTSTFTCATQLAPYQRVHVFGTEGHIEIEIPFNAPPDRPCRLWHTRGDEVHEVVFEPCNQYTIQADLFSLAVLDDTDVPTPLEDAVANMRVIEALVQSSEQGRRITLPPAASRASDD